MARWLAFALLCVLSWGCKKEGSRNDSQSTSKPPTKSDSPEAPKNSTTPHSATKDDGSQSPQCQTLPFKDSVPVSEASGAALIPGTNDLVVVGDSGTRGAFAIINAETGELKEKGRLPLDPQVHDDLEGAAFRGGKLHVLASNGYAQVFERAKTGFVRNSPAYAIGPKPWQCSPRRSNCGANFEGLCLSQKSDSPCIGYAVSKKHGILYCLTEDEGRLALSQKRYIRVSRPRALSGCHIGEDGDLVVGTNVFGGNYVHRVRGWQSGKPEISPVGRIGPGNSEAIAINRNGEIIRFADNGVRAPSPVKKYECSR